MVDKTGIEPFNPGVGDMGVGGETLQRGVKGGRGDRAVVEPVLQLLVILVKDRLGRVDVKIIMGRLKAFI